VTGNNGGGCTGTASATVSVSESPTVTATASPATICPGGSSTLTASGNANVFQWNTGQIGQTITVSPSTTTTYFVAGYNGFNCRGIGQVDVTVDASACSGSGARISSNDGKEPQINEDEPKEIALYPNPNTGVTYIKNAPSNGVVEVYNQIGQRVTTSTIENGSAEINLLEQVKGVYFIKISQSGRPVYQGRVIKIE
jgi:hypothetical protein